MFTQCWNIVGDDGPASYQHWVSVSNTVPSMFLSLLKLGTTSANMRRSPNVVLMLASVEDGGPTLKHYWVNVSCLLGHFPKGSSTQTIRKE